MSCWVLTVLICNGEENASTNTGSCWRRRRQCSTVWRVLLLLIIIVFKRAFLLMPPPRGRWLFRDLRFPVIQRASLMARREFFLLDSSVIWRRESQTMAQVCSDRRFGYFSVTRMDPFSAVFNRRRISPCSVTFFLISITHPLQSLFLVVWRNPWGSAFLDLNRDSCNYVHSIVIRRDPAIHFYVHHSWVQRSRTLCQHQTKESLI